MKHITRRTFLAASAGAIAAPALAAPAAPADIDVIIVGAGAAGIAAARRILAAGRRCVVLEAAGRVGGRCVTDTSLFGVPFDRGAHWIWWPETNPLVKLARQDFTIEPASMRLNLRVGRRNGRDAELEQLLGMLVRTNRAIEEAARGKSDSSCADALPRDLRDWRPTIEFMLGPHLCGKDLREVSAQDFDKAAERDRAAFCRQGYGALLARLARGLPIRLSTPATRIEWKDRVEVETEKGRLSARAVIITASTDAVLAGELKFVPELPKRHLDALGHLRLGSYDHIALELADNPLGLDRDEPVFEKSDGPRTAALLANIGGTSIATVSVGGSFGRDLSRQGERAMIDFAVDWLAGLYGSDIRKVVKRAQATRWNAEPHVRGAISVAAPGRQGARRVLMEPVRDRIWFAGEAMHEVQWGTVNGAWESGTRTAEAALRKLGLLREPEEPKGKPAPKQAPKQSPRQSPPQTGRPRS
ncbi:MAG TPA: NAD(P)/FAD-dependent oxidoreductase [Xanthobacteraceae bacterium]|nr:NAD(P)/FAD-dependent oxidoreductase [Xanthobacteraceae bacterium]